MTSPTFAALGLTELLLRALGAQHFTTPTLIQAAAIPPLLAGRDLLGIAQTGTGKTAALVCHCYSAWPPPTSAPHRSTPAR